jgi:hypothetical protein
MDRTELAASLVEDFGYSTRAAEIAAARLLGSRSEIREAFRLWRARGVQPTLCIAGYTVDRLIREHGMLPVAALLTLDWLAREPSRAAESLRKGHDRVSSRPHG